MVGHLGACHQQFLIRSKSASMRDLGRWAGAKRRPQESMTEGRSLAAPSLPLATPTTWHALLWTKETGMQDLGTPPGMSFGGIGALNFFGQIVGAVCPVPCLSQESVHPFSWSDATGSLDLNTLIPGDPGWVLENASAINALGQITGQRVYQSSISLLCSKAEARATQVATKRREAIRSRAA
jgi:hypothetical protein